MDRTTDWPQNDDSGPSRVLEVECAGEAVPFEAIFLEHYNPLCIFAERYVRSSEVAEDIVAEVFLRIWERGHHAEPARFGSLKSYLYTAVRNQALKHLEHERVVRRSKAAAALEDWSPATGNAVPLPDQQLEADEFARALQQAIDELPERTREAFLLQRQHELSYAEIAAVMGTSVFSVKNQLIRAMKLLRKCLVDSFR